LGQIRRKNLKVLRVCDLMHDLQLLPSDDNTFEEDGGGNLSKGQKIRINLAFIKKATFIY
jgi:ABC-type multidrug transport system fused ATPase/permease subunit